ncbi:hypothetical protein Ac2012v2_004809 [Leucoagaricus gongylophorus]
MTQYWEPGTEYNYGDVVEYQGAYYKIVQPHRSQSDWTPDITPALWGRTQDPIHHQQEQYEQQQSWQYQQQQQQQQKPSWDYDKDEKSSTPQDEGENKNWFEEHKTEIGVAGGLALGLGALGAAVMHHGHKKEEKEGFEAWASAARAHGNEFHQYGPRGPATWVYNEGKNIPQSAVSTGVEHDWTLYIARAWIDGNVTPGKASDVFKKGAVIGYKDKEHHLDRYEILLGDMRGLRWVSTANKINVNYLGATPVEGGYENDQTPLYVVKAEHKGAWHPGKASIKINGALIPYDGGEKLIRDYQVLCYA